MANLPGPPVPQAILFATDSRLTQIRTGKTLDTAEKLFPLCVNAGLVLAGNYEIGKKCVEELQKKLGGKVMEVEEVITLAHSTFKHVSHGRVSRLSFMLGVYDNEFNQARLIGYEAPDFQPEELRGIRAIGSSRDIQELYKQKFETFVKERFSHGGVSCHPLEWVNFIQIVLNNAVIELGVDRCIGGLVQTAIIESDGFQWVGHSVRELNGKWISTNRKNGFWRMVEVDSGKEFIRTEKFPSGFFMISE